MIEVMISQTIFLGRRCYSIDSLFRSLSLSSVCHVVAKHSREQHFELIDIRWFCIKYCRLKKLSGTSAAFVSQFVCFSCMLCYHKKFTLVAHYLVTIQVSWFYIAALRLHCCCICGILHFSFQLVVFTDI